jgi:hypothetical protein
MRLFEMGHKDMEAPPQRWRKTIMTIALGEKTCAVQFLRKHVQALIC